MSNLHRDFHTQPSMHPELSNPQLGLFESKLSVHRAVHSPAGPHAFNKPGPQSVLGGANLFLMQQSLDARAAASTTTRSGLSEVRTIKSALEHSIFGSVNLHPTHLPQLLEPVVIHSHCSSFDNTPSPQFELAAAGTKNGQVVLIFRYERYAQTSGRLSGWNCVTPLYNVSP